MKIVCAWCDKDMGEKPPYEDKGVTHGICPECYREMMPEKKEKGEEGNPMSTEGKKCDIDDLLCQMQVLSHLKGMQSLLGEEKFRTSFPELEGLDTTLTEKITSQETSLKEALEQCGLGEVEKPEEE